MNVPRAPARWPTPRSAISRNAGSPKKKPSAAAAREGIEQAEREAAEARRKAEEERHRQEEEAKRKAELEAKKRFGEAEAKTAATRRTRHHRAPRGPSGAAAVPPARAPGVAADGSDEDEGPRQIRRGPGGVMRPAAAAQDHPQAGPAEGTRPPDAGHRAQRRRRARALDRLVPPPHPAPEGTRRQRAEGKARSAKW